MSQQQRQYEIVVFGATGYSMQLRPHELGTCTRANIVQLANILLSMSPDNFRRT